jgi:hypothetical protein
MKLEAVRWLTGLAGCTKSSNLNNVDGGTGLAKLILQLQTAQMQRLSTPTSSPNLGRHSRF